MTALLGTIGMLRFQARRDALQLTVWVFGIALLAVGSASSVAQQFGTAAARTALLQVALATPSLLALRGVPNGASLGSLEWFQLFAFLAVAVGLMNTFLAVRHGRGDEELGRRELLAATAIGRLAPLAATLVLGAAADVLVGGLCAAGFGALGLPGRGALLAGAALGVTGLAFLGVALLAGEVAPTARSANGVAVTAVLLAYALRGAGDALGAPDLDRLTLRAAWPTWVSPIGWGEQTFAFTSDRWGPLLLSVGLAAVTVGIAAVVRTRRDLGASLLRERPGRPRASRLLAGIGGLAVREQWPAVAGWAVGAALLGALVGPLAGAVRRATEADPRVAAMLAALGRTGGGSTALLSGVIMTFVGMLAAAAAVQSVLRLRQEEAEGRIEALLATPTGRIRVVSVALLAAAVAAVVVLGAAAATAVAGLSGSGGATARALGQAAVQVPSTLVCAAVAALLVATLPRAASAVAWGAYALAVVIGLFGRLANLPAPVRNASPFAATPAVPVTDWTGFVVLCVVAAAAAALALAAYRARDTPA